MVDGRAIVTQARSGNVPSNWHVIKEKRAVNVRVVIQAVLVIAVVLLALINLITNPNSAMEPGSGSGFDTASGIATWRAIDFVFFPIIAIIEAVVLSQQFRGRGTSGLLVLTPEGLVLTKVAHRATVAFAQEQTLDPKVEKGIVKFYYHDPDRNLANTLFIIPSGFGNPKQVAAQIKSTFDQYKRMAVGAAPMSQSSAYQPAPQQVPPPTLQS